MGDNLVEIIDRFLTGAKVSIRGDPVYPIWGLCEPIIGKVCLVHSHPLYHGFSST